MRRDHKSQCRSVFTFILIPNKIVSKIWLVHFYLTSGRLVQVRIGNKSMLALTIESYHLRLIFQRQQLSYD